MAAAQYSRFLDGEECPSLLTMDWIASQPLDWPEDDDRAVSDHLEKCAFCAHQFEIARRRASRTGARLVASLIGSEAIQKMRRSYAKQRIGMVASVGSKEANQTDKMVSELLVTLIELQRTLQVLARRRWETWASALPGIAALLALVVFGLIIKSNSVPIVSTYNQLPSDGNSLFLTPDVLPSTRIVGNISPLRKRDPTGFERVIDVALGESARDLVPYKDFFLATYNGSDHLLLNRMITKPRETVDLDLGVAANNEEPHDVQVFLVAVHKGRANPFDPILISKADDYGLLNVANTVNLRPPINRTEPLTSTGKIARFLDPQPGGVVGPVFQVKCEVKNVPEEQHIWLAVRNGTLVWPKVAIEKTDGISTVDELVEPTRTGVVRLVLIMVPSTADKKIRDWLQGTDFYGLDLQKLDAKVLDSIELKQEPAPT